MGGDDTIAGTLLSSGPKAVGRGRSVEQEIQEGDILGTYQLERLLGEGSMGRVFQARHVRLGRQVALKVLRPAFARDASFVQRFFQEARSVNHINHEHIVEIFDFVEDSQAGHVYCVMELLRGQSLAQLLEEEPLSLARIRRMAVQVCAALGAAHQLGVVHRDIKPDNLFITHRSGHADFVKVLDFGVAKVLNAENTMGTLDGSVIGTPTYMSPEQAAGLPVDPRADIYAVGTVLYELLSGRPPFQSPNFGQLVVKVITEPPPALPSHTPAGELVPQALAQLTMRCLAKEPADRPQQLSEVITALLADTAPEAPEVALADERPTQVLPVSASPGSRRQLLALAGGALALLLGGLLLWGGSGAEAPPTMAEAPTALQAPAVVPEQAAPPEELKVPSRTLDPRTKKAGMRDAIIDPFAR